MPSAADRIDFAPPRDAGAIRSFGLALLVHAALIAALTWGVNWKRSDKAASFEAELWSAAPQEAAPKLAESLAPPPAALPAQPAPPEPAPPPKVQAPESTVPNVDIALEQEKKRKLLEQQQAQAKLKLATDAKKAEAKKQLEQAQANAAAQEAERQKIIARSLAQAGASGATGAETSKGAAQISSGPSASYGGKVKAKVKPNIVFTEDIAGNPSAEVEVRTALDGAIISQRLVKSSGNKAWDDAVVKAIIRTEVMPRDVDGRVPTPMLITFRPKD